LPALPDSTSKIAHTAAASISRVPIAELKSTELSRMEVQGNGNVAIKSSQDAWIFLNVAERIPKGMKMMRNPSEESLERFRMAG
jgi:hypothetical protein